jgi:hypothetical protein
MRAPFERLAGIRARSAREILAWLGRRAEKARGDAGAGDLPRVRIDTPHAQSYEGVLLDLQEHASGCHALLARETPGGGSVQAVYLDLREPLQITILEPESFAGDLRFGDISRWSDDAAMSALQLKRCVEEAKKFFGDAGVLVDCDASLFAQEGVRGNCVRDVLEAMRRFFESNSRDEAGRKALGAIKTLRLSFAPGKTLAVSRADGGLRIDFDPGEGLPPKASFSESLDRAI